MRPTSTHLIEEFPDPNYQQTVKPPLFFQQDGTPSNYYSLMEDGLLEVG